jgi:hypothetical protein
MTMETVVMVGALASTRHPHRATATLAPGCVPRLVDVRSGHGEKAFASHYVTAGSFGYGEFVAGTLRGQSLWRHRAGAWCRIPTALAVLDRATIVGFGVPPDVAKRLVHEMRAGTRELAPPTIGVRDR